MSPLARRVDYVDGLLDLPFVGPKHATDLGHDADLFGGGGKRGGKLVDQLGDIADEFVTFGELVGEGVDEHGLVAINTGDCTLGLKAGDLCEVLPLRVGVELLLGERDLGLLVGGCVGVHGCGLQATSTVGNGGQHTPTNE